MFIPLVVATALLSAAPSAHPASHPNSHSSSRVTVSGARVTLELRCQVESVLEVLPLDVDGDGALDGRELESGRAELERYVRERYTISPERDATPIELGAFAFELHEARTEGFDEPSIDARTSVELAAAPERLSLRCTLFREANPFHRDSATVLWNDDEPAAWLFGEGVERWDFDPASARRGGVFASYVALGIEHILIGFDHIAFLLALLVAARRWRSIAAFVTAFTLAHSLTLAAAALGWVYVPSQLVEMAIALSIAYVAAVNLWSKTPSARWPEAFGFGLVHGLGFAGVLEESLIAEPLIVTALTGFNLGVELGQLAIVGVLGLVLQRVPGDRSAPGGERAWLVAKPARLGLSAVVAVLGLYWFAERAGWLGSGA